MTPTQSHDLRLRVQKPDIGARVDWGHPLTRGLVGAWLLQEGGSWMDYARRYMATLYTPSTSTTRVALAPSPGMVYPSARFVAANYNVIGTDTPISAQIVPTPPFTWVTSVVKTASSNNPAVVICHTYYGGGTGGGAYGIDVYNNNVRVWVYNPAVGFASATSAATISNDVRYVLGGVYNSTASRLCYINGRPDGSDTTSVSQPASLDTFALGCLYRSDNVGRGSNFLDGWIDWAYYYNRALSASEMLWLYQEPFAMFLLTMPRHARNAAAAATTARSFAVIVG